MTPSHTDKNAAPKAAFFCPENLPHKTDSIRFMGTPV